MFLDEALEQMMILLPLWLPIVLVGLGLHWIVVRSATLSALRAHEGARSSAGRVDAQPLGDEQGPA